MYRIFPNKRTLHILEASLEECRWLYNDTLGFRKQAWEDENRTADYYETKRRIPVLKALAPLWQLSIARYFKMLPNG